MADADSKGGPRPGDADEDERSAASSEASAASMASALLFLAAIAAGLYFGLWPKNIAPSKDPGFGDNVFASAPVIFAARLILLSSGVVLAVGGVFVIASIVKLWQAGRWFTRFGPFEAAPEAIGTLADEVEFWRASAIEQSEAAQELKVRLQEADELLDQLLSPKDEN